VKVIDLQILELGTGIVEEGLDDLDIGVHRPAAVVDQQDHLEAIGQTAVEDDRDLAAVAHRLSDRLVHIHDIPRPVRNHSPESLQGLAHLEFRQGALLAVVPVAPLQRHLDGGFVSGGAPHAHPVGMMARMADGGGSPRTDPAVPTVMRSSLILQPVEEIPDQLLWRVSGKLFLVEAEHFRRLFGSLQPLFKQQPGDVHPLGIGDLL